jgi:sec-independent protein translocase protein TatA
MFSQFAILGIGTSELLIILTAIVLLFGAKRLPELARSVGQSVQELKKSASSAGQIKQDVAAQVAEVKDNFITKI